jgi:hypothetical protein
MSPIMLAIEPPLTSVPLAAAGKADHRLAPVDDLGVDEGRRMGAAAEVGASDRGEKIRQRPGGVGGPHVPSPEAGMDVAHWIGRRHIRDLA